MSGDSGDGVKLRAKKSALNSAVRRCIHYNISVCVCHSTPLFSSYFIANSKRGRTVFSFLYHACLLNLLMLSISGTVARMPHDSKVSCHTTCLNKETLKLFFFKFLNYKVQFFILVTHVLLGSCFHK